MKIRRYEVLHDAVRLYPYRGKSLVAKNLDTSTSQVQRLLTPGNGASLGALTQALARLGVTVELRKAS